jgi:peptidoglycan/xylan/chitin deacetylase (PgdA/CDA1 family)
MSTRTAALAFSGLLFILLTSSCRKSIVGGCMPKPGIALTFDDNYIDDWYRNINFFDSFHVKVTFYISYYHKLNRDQKNKLMTLMNHGHEIAYHSVHHPDFVKYLQQNTMGKLEEEEINKGLKMMNKDGFFPTDFAYPYGSHNEVLDNCLQRRFKSVRYLNGTKDYARSFAKNTGNSELYGMGIDENSGKTTDQLIGLMRLAKLNNDCIVFVGHHINRKEFKMGVPMNKLRSLVMAARQLNLQFYTVSEISNP